MNGTPYVSRAKHFDRNSRQYVPSNTVIVGERIFDGIETDYADKVTLTPDQARYVATELWKIAEEIDGKRKKTSKINAVRRRTDEIAKQAKREAMA